MNGSSIKHGLMNKVYSLKIKGSRLKSSGYRIKTKEIYIMSAMEDKKLADNLGTK